LGEAGRRVEVETLARRKGLPKNGCPLYKRGNRSSRGESYRWSVKTRGAKSAKSTSPWEKRKCGSHRGESSTTTPERRENQSKKDCEEGNTRLHGDVGRCPSGGQGNSRLKKKIRLRVRRGMEVKKLGGRGRSIPLNP